MFFHHVNTIENNRKQNIPYLADTICKSNYIKKIEESNFQSELFPKEHC